MTNTTITMDMTLTDLTESYAWVDQQLEHLYNGYHFDDKMEDELYETTYDITFGRTTLAETKPKKYKEKCISKCHDFIKSIQKK
jgi:cell division GTPase FtsZ